MNCAWVQDHLLLYLAGELEPGQSASLIRHLERCQACAVMADKLAETAGQAEAALQTNVEAPAGLDARVMEVVRGLPAPRRSWRASFPRWPVLPRLALGATVLCLVVAGYFAGR